MDGCCVILTPPDPGLCFSTSTGVRTMPGLVQRTQPLAYVADLGNVNVAPRTWDDIVSRIDPDVDLGRRIRERTGRNRARRAESALTE